LFCCRPYFRLFTFFDLYRVCLSVFSCTVLFVSISQVIGCEDRLRNDLYCVEWGVKLYSNQANTQNYAKLYPQNGERIVTIDSVTSFHPMYKPLCLIHTTRPDAMQQFCRVGSGGVNWTKSPRRKKLQADRRTLRGICRSDFAA